MVMIICIIIIQKNLSLNGRSWFSGTQIMLTFQYLYHSDLLLLTQNNKHMLTLE